MNDREWRETLGNGLRSARETLGLSRREVAEQVEVDQYTIFRWEAGQRLPSLLHLRKLAGALRLQAGELLPEIRDYEPEVVIIKLIDGVLQAVVASPVEVP